MLYSLACYVPLVKSLKKCDHYVAEAFLTQSNINAKQWTYLCQNGGHRAFGNCEMNPRISLTSEHKQIITIRQTNLLRQTAPGKY